MSTVHTLAARCVELLGPGPLKPDLGAATGGRAVCRSDEVRRYLRDLVEPRLRIQVRGGMLPNELMRPTSLFYVNFVAEGLVRLAALAQLEGVDYWRWDVEKGNSALVRCRSCLAASRCGRWLCRAAHI